MKKIISIFSTIAILLSMAVCVSATEYTSPTIYLEVSGGTKAGEVVTVVGKYAGFDVTPYDDINTGSGQKATGVQVRIDIPGGIGAATAGEQFLRPGVTNTSGFATGAPQWNWDIANNQFTCGISGIEDPMQASGTLFTISMKLNKDVTEDLEFAFNSSYEQTIVYDNYADWTLGDTVQVKNATLVGDTLEAPAAPEPPVDPEPEEPEEQDPVPGTVTEKTALEGSESYMTVVDDNKVTRFVAMDEKTSVAATAASVLKATYAGETKQANLYKLLGVEAGAEGDVTIGKLTVKIVLPTSVITAPTAADFEIVVE